MRARLLLLVLPVVLTAAGGARAQSAPADSAARWDRFWRVSQLGVNYGYAVTSGETYAAFGDGREWTVFVNQRAWTIFGGRVAYGQIGLGEANDFESAYLTALDLFKQSYTNIALTIEYFSLGPSLHFDLGARHGLTLAGSYSWYTIVFELTDFRGHSHVPRTSADGWVVNAAYSFWPWEKTAFRFEVDYHSLDTEVDDLDFFYLFTGGEDPRVVSYQVGIVYAYGDIFR
jgi:hypothetical protein